MLRESNKPSRPSELAGPITRCLIVSKSRELAETDREAMVGILAEDLAEFPSDVVKTALRKWPRNLPQGKWWPTLAEIREECLWRVDRRRALLRKMARLAAGLRT